MDENWLLKVRHYRGGESVLKSDLSKQEAEDLRDEMNSSYQTDNYYCERFDPEKIRGFTLTDRQLEELLVNLK